MWKEKYRIGLENVDLQHKELFDRVAAFVQSLRGEGSWPSKLVKVQETMDFMQDYVITHFRWEEAYQQKIHYPGCAEHHKIHEEFRAEVQEYARHFRRNGYDEDSVQKLGGKLMAWLINHVVATDLKMAQYVQAKEGNC